MRRVKSQNMNRFVVVRRQIARIKTLQRERALAGVTVKKGGAK